MSWQRWKAPPSPLSKWDWIQSRLFPEFVAQVAVYARSPQRQDGLHLLVDCGAGTLDIATFNVGRQPGTNEDIYPILQSEVAPLGRTFSRTNFRELIRLRSGRILILSRQMQNCESDLVCKIARFTKLTIDSGSE